jgi:predicted small secreted protein
MKRALALAAAAVAVAVALAGCGTHAGAGSRLDTVGHSARTPARRRPSSPTWPAS